ncbi:hypothetical protein [Pseudonocardia sp.]|uniref:hypothetical protein n=1 Tax=Pseudonocardia sp. TaxID=60912 RepID=UPI00262E2F98|nr:hypothetical protein [Pseudonocardia sp.]
MSIQADTADRYVELSLESALLRVADHVGVLGRRTRRVRGPLVSAALAAGCGLIYVCDGRSPKRVAAGLAAGRADRVRRSAVGP